MLQASGWTREVGVRVPGHQFNWPQVGMSRRLSQEDSSRGKLLAILRAIPVIATSGDLLDVPSPCLPALARDDTERAASGSTP